MDDYVIIALIAFLSSAFTALMGMLFKLCYASKCRSTSLCCGCLKIERDTEHEQSMRNLQLGNHNEIRMPNYTNNTHPTIEEL
jgi:hypothetical protein